MQHLVVTVTEWSDMTTTHYRAMSDYLPTVRHVAFHGEVRILTVDQFAKAFPDIKLPGVGIAVSWEVPIIEG